MADASAAVTVVMIIVVVSSGPDAVVQSPEPTLTCRGPDVMAAKTARLALVSGTTSGIGLAAARQLVAGGWTVVGLARRESPLVDERYRHVQIDLRDLATLTARVPDSRLINH